MNMNTLKTLLSEIKELFPDITQQPDGIEEPSTATLSTESNITVTVPIESSEQPELSEPIRVGTPLEDVYSNITSEDDEVIRLLDNVNTVDDLDSVINHLETLNHNKQQQKPPTSNVAFNVMDDYPDNVENLKIQYNVLDATKYMTDDFHHSLYQYYVQSGFTTICLQHIVNLLNLTFVIALSGFLIFGINWSMMLNSDTTHELREYIGTNTWHTYHYYFLFYYIMMVLYWLYSVFQVAVNITKSRETKRYYEDVLNIPENMMSMLTWDDVMKTYLKVINKNYPQIKTEHILGRICRKDNYMISLIDNNILNTKMFGVDVFTKFVEFMIVKDIISPMVNNKLNYNLINNIDSWKRKLVKKTIGYFLLLPFLFMSFTTLLFMRHAEKYYTHNHEFSLREWTASGLLKFKLYNEPKHLTEQRLEKAKKDMDIFTQLFQPGWVSHIISHITFIFSSILGLFIIMTLLDERILVVVQIGSRNLLWYAAIFTSIITILKSYQTNIQVEQTHKQLLYKLIDKTTYCKKHWLENERNSDIYTSFAQYYTSRPVKWLKEWLSILVLPIYYWFYLIPQLERIVAHIRQNTTNDSIIGDIYDTHCNINLKSYVSNLIMDDKAIQEYAQQNELVTDIVTLPKNLVYVHKYFYLMS